MKQLFLSATAAFAARDYVSAERQFLECRNRVGDNPAVDYNLGVVYLRLESLGRARLYFERCLKLAPRDREAREQLRLVLAKLDEAEPPPPSWVHATWLVLRNALTGEEAIGLAAMLSLCAALLIGLWLLSPRRWLGGVALFAALLAVAGWTLGGSHIAEMLGDQRAIVVSEAASLRSGPGDEFGEITRLSEGQVVLLLEPPRLRLGPGVSITLERDEDSLWCEVRTKSNTRGYIRRSLVERI
ncbi:MAG: hypothetical protein ACUVX8_04025 [Candidatus Zipacnadales bacterium]